MPSLLLIEPHWEGHNMRYVAWISAEATRLGYDVWLATAKPFFAHPFFEEIQTDCRGNIKAIPLPNTGARPINGRLGYKFHYFNMFANLHRELEKRHELPDYILIPYLDYLAHAAGLAGTPFGSTPWGGIFINPDFHLRRMGVEAPQNASSRIKEMLFFRLLASGSLTSVFAFDELLLRYVHEKRPALDSAIRFLPEPVHLGGGSSRHEARRKLSIKDSETVILVYGVIDESKNLSPLLDASRHFPENASILVAGPQDGATKTLLASKYASELRKAGRLHELDAFIHGSEEHDVFLASDIVWVGYEGQYISSGVLLQAGMASLPVIACHEGLIGWLSKNHHLGPTVHPGNPKAVAAAVSKLTRDKDLAAEIGAAGRAHSRGHTTERFTLALGHELPRSFPLEST